MFRFPIQQLVATWVTSFPLLWITLPRTITYTLFSGHNVLNSLGHMPGCGMQLSSHYVLNRLKTCHIDRPLLLSTVLELGMALRAEVLTAAMPIHRA